MPGEGGTGAGTVLGENGALQCIRSAEHLDELQQVMEAPAPDEAYFAARRAWHTAMKDVQSQLSPSDSFYTPVVIEDVPFHVHGVTHYGTPEERQYVRQQVREWVDRGEQVFMEQGLDAFIGADVKQTLGENETRADIVEDMDDVSWARQNIPISDGGEEQCLDPIIAAAIDGHEEVSRRAATDSTFLPGLERYCERNALPIHLEREWLQRHAPELDHWRHGRSERMADYAVHTAVPDQYIDSVHMIVGARHRTGVLDYLREYHDGQKECDEDFVYYPTRESSSA